MRHFLLILLFLMFLTPLFPLSAENKKTEEEKGFLTVQTDPEGLDIYIDGKKVGVSPVEKLELPVGAHKLSISTDPCFKQVLFYTWNRTVNIMESETTLLKIKPEPVMNTISISELKVGERTLKGNNIYVDGKMVGTVPSKIEIPLCSKLLEVTELNSRKVVYSSNLDLVTGKITENEKKGYEITTKSDNDYKTPQPSSIREFKPPETSTGKSGFKSISIKKRSDKKIIGPYKWIGTAFIIGGVLLAGTAGLFDYLAWKEFQEYEKMGTEEEIRDKLNSGDTSKADYLIKRDDRYQKGKDFVIARNIFYAAGGAFAVTGIILLFVKPSKKEKKFETSFNFLPGPDGVFISTDISF